MQNEPPQVRSEFGLLFGGTGRVVVDLVSSEIHFEHCHTPRRFLARCEPVFTCPVSDVLSVHELSGTNRTELTVVTAHGTAQIPSTATHYAELHELLSEIAARTPDPPQTSHPMMVFVWLFGVLLGLCAAVVVWAKVLPSSSGGVALLLFMIIGALLGVGFLHLTIFLADRLRGICLVVPISTAVLGAALGAAVAVWLQKGYPRILAVIIGLAIGALVGIIRELRDQK